MGVVALGPGVYRIPTAGDFINSFAFIEADGSVTLVDTGTRFATKRIVNGLAAFGKHPRNIVPVMAGVFLTSLSASWNANEPGLVLAALFGTTLAPIAGRFGWHWGVLAGFVHASVAQTVGQVHGGLVLYNNGFAAGLVAAVLVPVILSLQPAGAKQD